MKRWMKYLLVAAGSLCLAVVSFVLCGYLIPAEVELDTQRELDATQAELYALISSYEGIERWLSRAAEDMGESYEIHHIGGPSSGVGMRVGFGPEDALLETWTMTAVDPPRSVTLEVDFQLFISHRSIELDPEGSKTRAHWKEVAHIDNPLLRWMLKFSTPGAIENRNAVLNAAGQVAHGDPTPDAS